MKATKAQRQAARDFLTGADLNGSRYGRPGVIVEKSAEAWTRSVLFVSRVYHPIHDGKPLSIAYHQGYAIGPRGGRRKVYDSLY